MMDSIQPWLFLCNSSTWQPHKSQLHIPSGNLPGRQGAQREQRLIVQTYYLGPGWPGKVYSWTGKELNKTFRVNPGLRLFYYFSLFLRQSTTLVLSFVTGVTRLFQRLKSRFFGLNYSAGSLSCEGLGEVLLRGSFLIYQDLPLFKRRHVIPKDCRIDRPLVVELFGQNINPH